MDQLQTCIDILNYLRNQPSNPNAFNDRVNDEWRSISTQEFLRDVKYLALGLQELGLHKGDRVGIMVTNSPEWSMINFAIMIAGGTVVPLFANISDDNFVFEVKQTNIKLLFIGGEEYWTLMQKHVELFNRIITVDEQIRYPSSHLIVNQLSLLMQQGSLIDQNEPFRYEQMEKEITSKDLAIIIYTSGSSGLPKGVELTQENIVGFLHNDPYSWEASEDRYLSVLPLEHVFGYNVNLWMIVWGISIYYSHDYKNFAQICQEVHPTALVVVPRLLEKVYSKMEERITLLKGFANRVAQLAFNIAKSKQKKWWHRFIRPFLDFLVYSKLRDSLGGELRVVISGGAALDAELHRFFESIGIPIYEGWGLTEACPVCASLPSHNQIGSVGGPLGGYEIKLTQEGEVLIRGRGVMHGYYKNPEATAKTIDSEGWLHTGDRGSINSEGILTILGRMKELYKTSTGEYVAPVPIEQSLGRNPLIEAAVVVAEGKKFTSCLIFLNQDQLKKIKEQENKSEQPDELFLKSLTVSEKINHIVTQVNQHLNHWEQIRAYRLITDPLTIQGGELTPSMKIKRTLILNKYSHLVDEMYA